MREYVPSYYYVFILLRYLTYLPLVQNWTHKGG